MDNTKKELIKSLEQLTLANDPIFKAAAIGSAKELSGAKINDPMAISKFIFFNLILPFPEIMNDERNDRLKQFCENIEPAILSNKFTR